MVSRELFLTEFEHQAGFAKLPLLSSILNASLFSYCLGTVSAVWRSQEVELLVQGLDFLSYLVKAHCLLLTRLNFWLSSSASTRDHEELCDLVCVLAWCRNLNWAGPIVIEVT